MRMMMRFTVPVEAGNEAMRTGALGGLPKILEALKPEAAYFGAENGERGGYIVFDMQDPSQIPAVAKPFFLAYNANVTIFPVMNADDLAKAGPAIDKALKEHGKVR